MSSEFEVEQEAPDTGAVERIAALLYTEATDKPWLVAGIEYAGVVDRDYYRGLAHRVIAALASRPAIDLSKLQRFDPASKDNYMRYMEEDTKGDYVRYDDVAALIEGETK